MSLSDISIKFTDKTLDDIVQKCSGVKCTGWRFIGGFKKGGKLIILTLDQVQIHS